YPDSADNLAQARQQARRVADEAGVRRIDRETLALWQRDTARTTYLFDVRNPEAYRAGHVAGSHSTPGGQLVQETDHYASVRGA
ncbi:rhodanese-related sulfurtransferase, partial [Salmonella enterica]